MFGKTNFSVAAAGTNSGDGKRGNVLGGQRQRRRLQLVRKEKCDCCPATNLALDCGRAAVEIDNRLYQGQTKTGAIGAAR
jgi:hypothetical protein